MHWLFLCILLFANSDAVSDYCSSHRCTFNTTVAVERRTEAVTVSTEHTVSNNTLLLLVNTTFLGDGADEPSANSVTAFVALFGANETLCAGRLCWLRFRWRSAHPLTYHMGARLEVADGALVFHEKLGV